jgi:hypothetical protein
LASSEAVAEVRSQHEEERRRWDEERRSLLLKNEQLSNALTNEVDSRVAALVDERLTALEVSHRRQLSELRGRSVEAIRRLGLIIDRSDVRFSFEEASVISALTGLSFADLFMEESDSRVLRRATMKKLRHAASLRDQEPQ